MRPLQRMVFALVCVSGAASTATSATLCYEIHDPGYGWISNGCWSSGVLSGRPSITGIRMRVEGLENTGVCYQAHLEGWGWQDPRCNGEDAGLPAGGPRIDGLRAWLDQPADRFETLCYQLVDVGTPSRVAACDGTDVGPGLGFDLLHARLAGPPLRGDHQRSVWELSPDARQRLAGFLWNCVDDAFVAEHASLRHDDPSSFFYGHRQLIRQRLEACLAAQPGGYEFVPLPFWNPSTSIPAELLPVKPWNDGSARPPLADGDIGDDSRARAPATILPPQVCTIPSVTSLRWPVASWHDKVNALVGGSLANAQTAAAALIFGPWAAYVDNVLTGWESCAAQCQGPPAAPTVTILGIAPYGGVSAQINTSDPGPYDWYVDGRLVKDDGAAQEFLPGGGCGGHLLGASVTTVCGTTMSEPRPEHYYSINCRR